MEDFEKNDYQGGYFGTGSTRPPKSRRGVITVLLILVILLGSVVSLMSIWNIKLFQSLQAQQQEAESPVSFDASTVSKNTPTDPTEPVETVDMGESALSVDNIPTEGGLSLQQIYDRCADTVVSVTCLTDSGSVEGSGVILTQDGYIVTNCHVVASARTVWVRLHDGRELTAYLVGKDELSDLAVVRVEANALKNAQFGDSDLVRVGDAVVAIGDPLGSQLAGSMTNGIISAINRDITTGGRKMTLLQTNAALNEGNSGGPLINCYGQVIGINTLKLTASDTTVEGLGFAIPSRTVKTVVDQLIAQGYVSGRPTLGIEGKEVSQLYQRLYRIPAGVSVTATAENGAAAQAGLRPGDVITTLADRRTRSAEDLKAAVYTTVAGQKVELTFYREGKYYTVEVTMGQLQ